MAHIFPLSAVLLNPLLRLNIRFGELGLSAYPKTPSIECQAAPG
jgi:hypothetical protein